MDIVFAQYNPEDEEADGAEGAVVAKQLYADGKCKNIILCADSNDELQRNYMRMKKISALLGREKEEFS